MRALLLCSISTHALQPNILRRIAKLAEAAVAPPEYKDPRAGTWGDNPVGGAPERDGQWLGAETRDGLRALLQNCTARAGLEARLSASGSACLQVAAAERYCVQVLALEAGGCAVRETFPSGTVVLSRVVRGRAETVPLSLPA